MSDHEQSQVPESRVLAPKPEKSKGEPSGGGGLGGPEATTETKAVAPPALGEEQAKKRREGG